jgi:hypothetical protein
MEFDKINNLPNETICNILSNITDAQEISKILRINSRFRDLGVKCFSRIERSSKLIPISFVMKLPNLIRVSPSIFIRTQDELNILTTHPKLQNINLVFHQHFLTTSSFGPGGVYEVFYNFVNSFKNNKSKYVIKLDDERIIITPTTFQCTHFSLIYRTFLNLLQSSIPTLNTLIIIYEYHPGSISYITNISQLIISIDMNTKLISRLISDAWNSPITSISIMRDSCIARSRRKTLIRDLSLELRDILQTVNPIIDTFDVPIQSEYIGNYLSKLPNVNELTIYYRGDGDLDVLLAFDCSYKILVSVDIPIEELPVNRRFKYIQI